MDPFVFSTEPVITTAPDGYVPFFLQATNLAAGINRDHVVGTAQMVKVGGSDVTFYVSRQNPLSLLTDLHLKKYVDGAWEQGGYDPRVTKYAVALRDYQRLVDGLNAMKLLSCSGNDALLGLVVDAISLDEFNWVTVISRDVTEVASIDVSIQFIQQFYADARFTSGVVG